MFECCNVIYMAEQHSYALSTLVVCYINKYVIYLKVFYFYKRKHFSNLFIYLGFIIYLGFL